MRLFSVLFVLMLSGCMKTSDLAYGTRYHLADVGVLNQQQIERAGNRRIERDALIYIVQSHFPPVDHKPVAENILAVQTFNAFVEYFPRMRRAQGPLGLDDAMAAARHEKADFLLYTRFAWAQERKVMDRAVIQFMLYETTIGYLVDNARLYTRGGLFTSRQNKPEDFLRAPMKEYAKRLQGLSP